MRMKTRSIWVVLPFIGSISQALAAATPVDTSDLQEIANRFTKRTANGIHLPIVHRESSRVSRRGSSTTIGLGDSLDAAYSCLVTVGGIATPLLIDTGSADLWVMSDQCVKGCSGVELFPQSTFKSSDIAISLRYGDSQTTTFANGLAGSDSVDVGGITLKDQTFAAINFTNTSIGDTGSAGILGLGFPINSAVWAEVFQDQSTNAIVGSQPAARNTLNRRLTKFGDAFSKLNLRRLSFPSLSEMFAPEDQTPPAARHESRQASSSSSSTPSTFDRALASFSSIGPFVPRLVMQGLIAEPLIAVTLQRETVDIGGNVGMLSIGELPPDVDANAMTWTLLRKYSSDEGGLPAPSGSPDEVYPIAWEIPIDDVYFDGVKLPRSRLAPASLGYSALLDTGNSLNRGPEDLVKWIDDKLGPKGLFPCDEPHTLSFQIGGKMFPVDPRDFISQAYENNVDVCSSTVVPTDPPSADGGYLFSWSLGTPFLKGVISSFYFGNITYPSKNEPRIGLLSTVPDNADDLLKAAVAAASKTKNFPYTSQAAPTGTALPGNIDSHSSVKSSSNKSSATRENQYIPTASLLMVLSGVIFSLLDFGFS